MKITTTTDNRVRLTGVVKIGDSVRALLFGEMVKLATPRVHHYHSDLYHDALWMARHVDGPTAFYFGADDCGTAIGTDEGLVRMSRRNVWHVALECDDAGLSGMDAGSGTWYAVLTPIATEETGR